VAIPAALVVAVVCLGLTGCGRQERPTERLTLVHRGWPLELLPNIKSEVITLSVQSNIFEGLVGFSPEMKIIPMLAESWENPDERTWVFKLRPGVRFHDGSVMSAEDVVFSLRRVKEDQRSTLKASFIFVDTISAASADRVVITTSRPSPLLLNRLVAAFILPKRAYQEMGEERFREALIGTGPYRLKSIRPETSISLEWWDDYWGPLPAWQAIDMLTEPDPEKARALLTSGRADMLAHIDPRLARGIEELRSSTCRVMTSPGLMLRYLGYDLRAKPFDSRDARRAISMAIDRGRLIERIQLGYGHPASQMITKVVYGYKPGLPVAPYDPDGARQLLQKLGYPSGVDLELTFPEVRQRLAEEIQSQMGAAGIRLKLRSLPRDEFFRGLGSFDFFLFGLASTSGDASDVLDEDFHTPTGAYGVTNIGGYSNPAVDTLIERSDMMLDPNQRLRLLQEINTRIMDDLPRIPLFGEDEIYAVSSRLAWKPRFDILVLVRDIQPAP